jgi:hypothetical protein
MGTGFHVWAGRGNDRAHHRIGYKDQDIARAEEIVRKVEATIDGGERPSVAEMTALANGLSPSP